MLVDSHLMLSKQVNSVCKSAFFSVSSIGRVGRHLDCDKQMLLAVPKTKTKRYGDRSFAARAPRLQNAREDSCSNSAIEYRD